MLPNRRMCESALVALLVFGLTGLVLTGGCPQPQQPGQVTRPDNEESPEDVTPDQGQQDRPIPPPVIDTGEPEEEEPTPDEGETGGGSEPGGTSAVSVRFSSPLLPVAMRPGPDIHVVFRLNDSSGLVNRTELVLARDDNQDGQPDGNPLWTKVITAAPGSNTVPFDTDEAVPLLVNGFGRFVLGVRVQTSLGQQQLSYAAGAVTLDAVAPTVTWLSPTENQVTNPTNWTVRLQTSDNSKHTVQVVLDKDTNPANGFAGVLVESTEFEAGTAVRELTRPLSISSGTYYYYVVVSDGIDPPTTIYAPNLSQGGTAKLRLLVTRRLNGLFNLNRLDPSSPLYDNTGTNSTGAIFRGFNFNDLAGSSMAGVPDLDGDGFDEFLVASRFGKPRVHGQQGVGWGEAYLILGSAGRFRGATGLNQVGNLSGSGLQGLVFTGIRAPRTTSWSEGLSDVTYVPDMDGDNRPDLVFSFPRVESVSLANSVWQHPELAPYAVGMGSLEYDPAADVADTVDIPDPANPGSFFVKRSDYEVEVDGATWLKNRTHFTRGGIVIVSSHNSMFSSKTKLNRKGNRIIDLHEVGQCFNDMGRGELRPLVEASQSAQKSAQCGDPPQPTNYEEVTVFWEFIYRRQGPIGFHNWLTSYAYWDSLHPPLANMRTAPSMGWIEENYLPSNQDPCTDAHCVIINQWLPYTPCNPIDTGTASLYFPTGANPLRDPGYYIHTGFYGREDPEGVSPWSETVGARVLGQRVNSRFGTAVSSDQTWLYISAPGQSVRQADVPILGSELIRAESGTVYQYRINSPASVGGPTRSQLWIEPGTRQILDPNQPNADPNDPNSYINVDLEWPFVDAERENHRDYSMPIPHTYIIEEVGSERGVDYFWRDEWARLFGPEAEYVERTRIIDYALAVPGCAANELRQPTVQGAVRTVAPCESDVWPAGGVGSSRWYIKDTPQIVGPHPGAHLSFVRAVGDIDNDGVGDFAVGSADVRADIAGGTGPKVGAVFIVFGRPPGLEGDYLLERLALDIEHRDRLAGVVLKGNPAGTDSLARVFAGLRNFNGDVFDDVAVGNESGAATKGEVIVLLGSRELQSPGGGWTIDQAMQAGVAIRFEGEKVGDMAGANVAVAGDVDGDGLNDLLIAAPGVDADINGDGQPELDVGAVYLIYGSREFTGGQTISLAKVGTFDLPGVKFLGRKAGDALGAGKLVYGDRAPGNPNGMIFLNPDETPVTVYSDGMVTIGDLDGDGLDDFAISAMLADPLGRRDAGEVYVIYGSRN